MHPLSLTTFLRTPAIAPIKPPSPAELTGWFCFLVAGSALLITAVVTTARYLNSRPRRPRHACPVCSYDCRATRHRCPECGTILPRV